MGAFLYMGKWGADVVIIETNPGLRSRKKKGKMDAYRLMTG
jgi:hypothetical protein